MAGGQSLAVRQLRCSPMQTSFVSRTRGGLRWVADSSLCVSVCGSFVQVQSTCTFTTQKKLTDQDQGEEEKVELGRENTDDSIVRGIE